MNRATILPAIASLAIGAAIFAAWPPSVDAAVANLPPVVGTDVGAIHVDVAGEIAGIAEKLTPVDADLLVVEDSADSNAKARVQIGNLPDAGAGFTDGSVVFADGGALTEDNDGIFFDDTLNHLGVGTASPGAELDVLVTVDASAIWRSSGHSRRVTITTNDGGTSAVLQISQDAGVGDDTWSLGVAAADSRFFIGQPGENEVVTILNTGEVGIGDQSPDFDLDLEGDDTGGLIAKFSNLGSSTTREGIGIQCGEDSPVGTNVFVRFTDGDGGDQGGLHSVAGATLVIFAASDERLKEDIAPTELDALELLNSIPLSQFRKVKNSLDDEPNPDAPTTPVGVIAQDVIGIYPGLVTLDTDDVYKVSPGVLLWPLVRAVQQLTERIEALEMAN